MKDSECLALSQSSTSIATNPHGLQYTCFCQTGFSIVAGKRLNAVATMQKFSFGLQTIYIFRDLVITAMLLPSTGSLSAIHRSWSGSLRESNSPLRASDIRVVNVLEQRGNPICGDWTGYIDPHPISYVPL
ncbi:uncharacterized protein STEHIDRAFT_116472 [Stereum hirsutum FP-91666 SS1]|uniref:Uncharacterized protein n=1 Tax=Stereum hirsutum (strain FP-91666) TaxID=721885 RepID=R7RWB3_STEHR|nr:uncharacterized protein STEHIDRAFT_116472 [Stereum hirsutum FP-91666 SS1]EIM79584.1 hypothetical protein STEHIDRAFT_116472 [Stereum hirsutum FP-91666 SS1]